MVKDSSLQYTNRPTGGHHAVERGTAFILTFTDNPAGRNKCMHAHTYTYTCGAL